MMNLVEKHEFVTLRHMKMINRTKYQLKSSMVLTTLGPDHCDLHILEHPSKDIQTELEEIGPSNVVKTEESDDSLSVYGEIEVIHEEDNNINDLVQDPLKYESVPFQCKLCLKEFFHDHAYMQHMSVHLQNGDGDGECDTSQVCKPHTAVSSRSLHSSLITENKQADSSPSSDAVQTTVFPPSASLVTSNEINPTEEVDTNVSCRYKRLTDCSVKLYDIFSMKVVQRQDGSLMKTQRDALSCDSLNTVSKDFSHQVPRQDEVPTAEYIEPVAVKVIVSKTSQSKTDDINNIQCINSSQYSSHTAKSSFICNICGKNYKQKCFLVKHVKNHTEERRFTCKICQYKCKRNSYLTAHMKTHTREKPFTCQICNSKFAQSSYLVYHLRTHTGIKPYACELCEYKCAKGSNLVRHMRIHTGEKLYFCEICEYKCSDKSSLLKHVRTHTGEKPFTCNICNSKFARSGVLVCHMRSHTGIKPYACQLCEYRCAKGSNLVSHMRIHTGEKPFSCKICKYKCAHKSSLVTHMRTHSGSNP